ncbi:MAG: ABC transporter substrate-binding protein [Chloroflexota bacterium]
MRILLSLFAPLLLLALLAACMPNFSEPPRLSAPTVGADTVIGGNDEPLVLPAPTATGEPVTTGVSTDEQQPVNPTVTLWVNRSSPQYEAALEAMVDDFRATHNIHIELVTIEPDLLPDLVRHAAVSRTEQLPDVIIFPLEYAVGWAERDILDPAAAQTIIDELGPETFNAEALQLVQVNGQAAAIPSDGWQQILLYRSDWFQERGLQPPTSFDRMLTAAEVISDRANLIYSFNMPTESSLRATTLAFEHMAIANGCQLIDERGELQILSPACRDSLAFYHFTCNTYCPPGVQTDVSALNAYLSGRSGMILASPGVLAAIAGLDDRYPPTCAECDSPGYLAQNTAIVTGLTGRSPAAAAEPQNLGEIAYFGITPNADEEATAAFARYWFEEGYLTWLGVEPERKVPMRQGTQQEPNRYIDAWFELPFAAGGETISQFFGSELAETLAADVVNTNRWGYIQGQGQLITSVYEELTLSILLQELLSGYYDSDRAAIEGYKRLVDLIPNYQYYVDPEPTPED